MWRVSSPFRFAVDVIGAIAFVWMVGSSLWVFAASSAGIDSGLLWVTFRSVILPWAALYTLLLSSNLALLFQWLRRGEVEWRRPVVAMLAAASVAIVAVAYTDIRARSRQDLIVGRLMDLPTLACTPTDGHYASALDGLARSERFAFVGPDIDWTLRRVALLAKIESLLQQSGDEYSTVERYALVGSPQIDLNDSASDFDSEAIRASCR